MPYLPPLPSRTRILRVSRSISSVFSEHSIVLVIIDYAEYSGDLVFIKKVRYLIADLQELVGYFFAVHFVICLDRDAIPIDGGSL